MFLSNLTGHHIILHGLVSAGRPVSFKKSSKGAVPTLLTGNRVVTTSFKNSTAEIMKNSQQEDIPSRAYDDVSTMVKAPAMQGEVHKTPSGCARWVRSFKAV